MDREEILKEGKADIRVKRAGIFQILTFTIARERIPIGEVPYLTVDRFVDLPELMRIAEEFQLPVSAKNGKIFPKGKSAKDFAGL